MKKGPEISGFILAGGKSSRMGTNKALLEINNVPMLRRMIRLIEPFCSHIAISGDRQEYADFGFEMVSDIYSGIGPIAGLHSVIIHSSTEWNLLISVDSPFLNEELIDLLIKNIGAFDCVVPTHSSGVEPLIGLYNKRALTKVETQISQDNYKLSDLLSVLNTGFVDCSALIEKYPRLFTNINYPEDYWAI